MSAAYKRKGRSVRSAKVPTESGAWVERSTGTADPKAARGIQRMIADLGPRGRCAWDILRLVTARRKRGTKAGLSLAELWRRWNETPWRKHRATGQPIEPSVDERLEHVRASLFAVDLRELVCEWEKVLLRPGSGITRDVAEHYVGAVRLHLPERTSDDDAPLGLAELTETKLRTWLESMDGVASGTVRKRGIGMRRFITWLRGRGVLGYNPMAEVKLPRQGKPRVKYLETAEAKALADAQPGQYRVLSALLAGSGIEVSVALGLRIRDIDRTTREIRAAGTKTYNRDRIVRVAEWAWAYLEPLLRGKHTDALVFDEIPDRWEAGDSHRAAVKALVEKGRSVFSGYTMRDARHTYAVRAAKAGTPAELIARQLGHVNAVLVLQVYGRFMPSAADREKWERIAAERDAAIEKETMSP